MAILKIRDKNGNVIPVPVVTGDNGNLSNALKGYASGKNAVVINDLSSAPHKLKVSVNLIDQEEFFGTNRYELKGEVGKTYTLSCVLKEGADITGVESGIYDTYDGGMVNFNFFTNGDEQDTVTGITIEEGHTYHWDTSGANASDIFESVSMVLTDSNEVGVKTYGKNILDYDMSMWVQQADGHYETPLTLPVGCTITISGKFTTDTLPEGYVYVYQSTDGWVTREHVPSTYKGVWVGTKIYVLTFTPQQGVEYRLHLRKSTYSICNSYLEGIQIEVGTKATEHEKYKEPIDGAAFVYPTATLISDNDGTITAEYNKDINKAFAELEAQINSLKASILNLTTN